ncbi:D-alanyl-D-alanine carboxypeptidase [Streptomyces sp. D2-8]|uniref:D-alanyl-D-alanine carboxypeptidase n=1 Tax=Streptomyces sp. D2-8 TaxID=2707767 RepID=UPI0020C14A61|nr:D-alanyl-D-alanine carboxypeptidase [Streptomyces sp. D2-8]MCK8434332.1 D-alanyl-D-alanine carboxypeptidase [Streptomyces sp. D2-8]
MAGESPDRSKQRESSARKTSGSASPVPEARSEAADPRLAVARDPERSSARGGADTATRVLSTRTAEGPKNTERAASGADTEDDGEQRESDSGAEDTAADAGQGASGSSGEAEGSEGSEAGESSGAEGSDGRLRDAVAAWVASADGGKAPAAGKDAEDEGDGKAPEAERAEKAEKADADAQEAGKAPGTAETGTDAEDGQEAAGAASEGSGAGRDDADEPEADRSVSAAESKADDERSDDEGPEPADPRADNDVKTADADADTDADTADAKADEPADDDVEAADTDTGADADTTDAKADEPADDESPEPADPRVSDDAEAAPKATDADTDTEDDAAEGEARTDGTAKDKPGTDGTPESDGDTDDAPAEPPVDQPTAVFKAVRPPVDQPTTMLKLGGGTKDAPEKDAERTSKFVALKPLDEPSARKPAAPAAPADATAPVPTVGPERTTQQPLPPRPPLDLLAELTNTPPPPETPLRTAARRVKIWTPLVLLLVVVFAVVQSVRPLPSPTLELTAEDSYTFEGGKVDIPWPADGQAALDVQGIGTFGSSGEQKPVPIASVAKVMTAYVILRDHPLKSGEDGPKILIDQAAQDQSDAGQESTVDVTKDDKITQREALESILIASANNVARLLARWDAGSEKAFVRKMNQAALDLGMKNTTYTDPSGLNNTTVSTAVDQVKLAKAAMQQPVFREVATMMSYVDYKGKKHDNWNRLVGYNDVTGIKTGTTTSALGNLVFAAKKDVNGETRRIIGAVVRQPAGGPDNTILGAALHEGDKLIRAAQGALESATILKKGEIVGYADDGLGGRTPVAVTEDVTAVGWAGLSVKLTFAGDDLPHTAKAGTKVGTLTVGDGTTSAVKVPVALQKDLVEPDFGAKLTRLG